MRYILTERQMENLLGSINEQLAMATDIITSASDFGVNIDSTGDLSGGKSCEKQKTSAQKVMDAFSRSRTLSGKPNMNDKTIQNWVSRISKSMEGTGITSDFQKVLSEIKTAQQLGSVLDAYNYKYKRLLFNDLKGEYTISWDTIWTSIKKFQPTLKIDTCAKRPEYIIRSA
jgi:hypothetical protein